MDSKRMVLLLISSSVAFFCLCPKDSYSAAVRSQDPLQCVQEFVRWCENNSYSSLGGISIVSSSVILNGNYVRLYCRTDPEGTMCMRDGAPWFHCYPNKTLQYNGQWLAADSPGDSGICAARDQALHFQSGLKFNSTAFKKEFGKKMEKFDQHMLDFRRRMDKFTRKLSSMFQSMWPFGYNTFDDLDTDFYEIDNESYVL